MKFFRFLLLPFAILYHLVTACRNFLFDHHILKSYQFDLPVVCVGNLNVGGTGKTPQIEYIIRLLSLHFTIATLSRGYKRQTNGFVLADDLATAQSIGDEPFQFYNKFSNIQVAVDSDRKNGIERLLKSTKTPNIILLDDAYQHRRVKAGFYILLTTYGDLYTNDYLLPAGNLRESRAGAVRANIIIVTKCPKNIGQLQQQNIVKQLGSAANQNVFFSYTDYDDFIYNNNNKIAITNIRAQKKLIVAGIANPKPFFDFIKNNTDLTLTFADHHDFDVNDICKIKLLAQEHLIITTEKDFVRLKKYDITNLYYLPIKSVFVNNQSAFDQLIFDFIDHQCGLQ